ncbi:hypothetical protein WJX75_001275 [Coccomyxa subellipsoidea]|uniref:Protein kinase domain-containing protein n=1 Tax=Coccomyxa subellipsoidea TaxID=248742 RepID=A0ABR2YKB1_9CHLO
MYKGKRGSSPQQGKGVAKSTRSSNKGGGSRGKSRASQAPATQLDASWRIKALVSTAASFDLDMPETILGSGECGYVFGCRCGQSQRPGCGRQADHRALLPAATRALAAIHTLGVLHRDLRADNILVAPPTAASGSPTVQFVDFGYARCGSSLADRQQEMDSLVSLFQQAADTRR